MTFFRRFFLVSDCQKISEEAFCVSKNSGNENIYAWEGGLHGSVGIFCLAQPKKFIGGTLVIQKCSGMEKNSRISGKVTQFPSKFFVSQCRENS